MQTCKHVWSIDPGKLAFEVDPSAITHLQWKIEDERTQVASPGTKIRSPGMCVRVRSMAQSPDARAHAGPPDGMQAALKAAAPFDIVACDMNIDSRDAAKMLGALLGLMRYD